MNYLGIDLGDKVCGLAYTLEGIIFTLPSIQRHLLVSYLNKLIKEKNITIIVVGLPYDLYNKDNRQLNKTLKFIDKLKTIFPNIKIDSIDERYTTFESLNILNQFDKENIKEKKDSMRALLILESYIKKHS